MNLDKTLNVLNTETDNLIRLSRSEAEEAVRILIRWAGDDPNRAGLTNTPARVARSYEDFFSVIKKIQEKFFN